MNDNLQGWTTNTAKHPSSPVMQRTLWCLAQAVCAQDTWEHHKARVDKARAWLWHLTAFGKPSPTNSHPPCELSKLYTKSTTLKDNPERGGGGILFHTTCWTEHVLSFKDSQKDGGKKREKKKQKKRVGKGRRHNHFTKHNSSDIYSSTQVQHSSTVEARRSMSTNSLTQITQTSNNKLLVMFRMLCNPCSNINQFQRQHEERADYCRLKMCANDNDRVGTTSAVEKNTTTNKTQNK